MADPKTNMGLWCLFRLGWDVTLDGWTRRAAVLLRQLAKTRWWLCFFLKVWMVFIGKLEIPLDLGIPT